MNHQIKIPAHGTTGDTLILCDIIYPHTLEWELGMIQSKLSGGLIEWRDLQFNNYSGRLNIETDETNGPLIEGFLKKPVDLMASSISEIGALRKSCGFLYFLKSPGVTMLTCLSVHWADKIVDINN